MNKKLKLSFFTLLCILVAQHHLLAQANPNPCSFPGVKCQNGGGNGIINSFNTNNIVYTNPGRSMPFWFAYGDTITNTIDTSTNAIFAISGVLGPGDMHGNNASQSAKYCYLNNIEFTEAGQYNIRVTMSKGIFLDKWFNFEVLHEEDFCSKAPSGHCSNIKGNKIFAQGPVGNVITVDAVFPIIVAVIDSISGSIDSTFSGTIYAAKISGPGMLYGTLSMSGVKWFNFTNLRFSMDGYYTIQFYEQDLNQYKSENVDVIVTPSSGLIDIKTQDIFTFPNPFNEQINVATGNTNSLVSYQIYDYTGRLVLQKTNENVGEHFIINTQNLSAGFYTLNIFSNNNSKQKNIIIVKQ